MADPEEGDRRIAKLERDMAEFQTQTIPCQYEAYLAISRLKAALDLALKRLGDDVERRDSVTWKPPSG